MFIVIVLGVLLIIGIAYVYKKVKALRASTAFNKVEEAFNKVKEAKKAKEEAEKVMDKAEKALEATPEHKALDEAWEAVKKTPEHKDYEEAFCAYKKMLVAYLEADLDWGRVKRSATSILKEEMEEEAW